MFKRTLIACTMTALVVLPQYTFAANVSAERRIYLLSYLTQLMQQLADLQEQLEEMLSENEKVESSEFKITEPDRGDEYYWGDTLTIRWEPDEVGVSTMRIMGDDDNEDMGIYGRKPHGDPVNTSGEFRYKLSNFYGSGDYYIEFTTEDGDV